MRSVKPGVGFCTTRYSTFTLGSRYSQWGLRAFRFLALKLWVSGPGLYGMYGVLGDCSSGLCFGFGLRTLGFVV